MLKEFVGGKELEQRVRSVLEENKFEFEEQPYLTPFNLRFDFLVSNKYGRLFAIETTKRNSIEDIQRLCFRCMACKEFDKELKTVVIFPAFKGNLVRLRMISILVRFSDMFLFEEDLSLLPDLLNSTNKGVFFDLIKRYVAFAEPGFERILSFLQENTFARIGEISESCDMPKSRVRQLVERNAFSLTTLGLVELVGGTCMLNGKFKIG